MSKSVVLANVPFLDSMSYSFLVNRIPIVAERVLSPSVTSLLLRKSEAATASPDQESSSTCAANAAETTALARTAQVLPNGIKCAYRGGILPPHGKLSLT